MDGTYRLEEERLGGSASTEEAIDLTEWEPLIAWAVNYFERTGVCDG